MRTLYAHMHMYMYIVYTCMYNHMYNHNVHAHHHCYMCMHGICGGFDACSFGGNGVSSWRV